MATAGETYRTHRDKYNVNSKTNFGGQLVSYDQAYSRIY